MSFFCFIAFLPVSCVAAILMLYVSPFVFWCSPEHPLMKTRARSILGGEQHSFQEYAESGVTSRFDN